MPELQLVRKSPDPGAIPYGVVLASCGDSTDEVRQDVVPLREDVPYTVELPGRGDCPYLFALVYKGADPWSAEHKLRAFDGCFLHVESEPAGLRGVALTGESIACHKTPQVAGAWRVNWDALDALEAGEYDLPGVEAVVEGHPNICVDLRIVAS